MEPGPPGSRSERPAGVDVDAVHPTTPTWQGSTVGGRGGAPMSDRGDGPVGTQGCADSLTAADMRMVHQ